MQQQLDFSPGRTRTPDYSTSEEGARSVAKRAGNQQDKLLKVYALEPFNGWTDEQAARLAGLLDSCYWKRCGELRKKKLIVPTGEVRVGAAGVSRMVCKLA